MTLAILKTFLWQLKSQWKAKLDFWCL